MQYQQMAPAPYLLPHVLYFWTLRTDMPMTEFKTVAEGSPGLIFHDAATGSVYQNDKVLPSFFLFGQATQHADIYLPAATMIGVCLHPLSLNRLFGMNADGLTDSCVDMNLLVDAANRSISEQLLGITDVRERINVISAYLHSRICATAADADPLTAHVIDLMQKNTGELQLTELQKQFSISERSLERRFKMLVGVSPKMFLRICSFRSCLQAMTANRYEKLSDIAYGFGYADQSHFIRSFREFSGVSPDQFQRKTLTTNAHFSGNPT